MIIALDYDKTYTADKKLWDEFIANAKSMGHSVICVTMRFENEVDDNFRQMQNVVDKVFFTGRKSKFVYLKNLGIAVDIWIDDTPYYILNDSF